MNYKLSFISILFFAFILKNIFAQVSIPETSYCEKSIEYLKNNCYSYKVSLTEDSCKIKEFKYLGYHNDKQFYYGLYSKKNGDEYEKLYFIIYEGKKNNNNLKPIDFLFPEDIFDYYLLEMTNTKYGLIIHIYLTNGNGGFDDGEYIIFRKERWKKLKMPNWKSVYVRI